MGILVAALAMACGSTGEPKVVVSDSPLAPEAERPLVPDTAPSEQRVDDPNRIVARVNDEIITFRSLVAEYGEALRNIGDEDPQVVREVIDRYSLRLVQFRLLAQAAEKMEFNITKADVERVAKAEDEEAKKRGTTLEKDLEERGVARWEWERDQLRLLKIRSFYAVALGDVKTENPKYRALADTFVRPSEVQAYYDRHPEMFHETEQAFLQAVFVRLADHQKEGLSAGEVRAAAEQAAQAIAARARGGEDFAALVKEVHKEPLEVFREPLSRGARNGDDVEKFAWSAKPGDVSDPVPLRTGFLVLRLDRRTTERNRPFPEVREEIEANLTALKRQVAQIQIQLAILEDAVIEPARLKKMLRDRLAADLAATFEELSR